MSKKTLLLIGASSELGRAYLKKNIDEYSTVIAHCNSNIDAVEKLKNEINMEKNEVNIVTCKADLSESAEIEAMLQMISEANLVPDHIVFLSSPKMKIEHFKKSVFEDYKLHIEVSYLSTVRILMDILPKMAKRKSGRILFMLSKITDGSAKFQASYAGAKYALLGLMQDLSNEYEEKGIYINALSPDMIETGFISEIPEMIVSQNAQNSKRGRNLTVWDVVPHMVELLDDECKKNGENIWI